MAARERGDRPEIVGDAKRATPPGSADEVVSAVAECARAAVEQAGASIHDVVGVGCGAPGPLDHRRGIVHMTPNIPALREYPLAPRLAEALDGLPVFLDRDTIVAAIGEALAGAARGQRDFVYVTVSTGIGGAIVSGGRMVRGATNTAGEIGHWPVAVEGPRCGCGSFGCVESFAGGRNLAQRYGASDAGKVFDAARGGDERARMLVERARAAIAALGIGLVNALNPARIVVGGGIAEHEPEHVLGALREGIRSRAFEVPAQAVAVVPAELGADVGMIGAVLMARERAAGRGEWFV